MLTIDSVRDSQGEIADGGETSELQLQIRGRAPADTLELKIYDGDIFLTDATLSDDGNWTANVSFSEIKDYVFVAKTPAPELSSNAWKVRIRQQTGLFIQSVTDSNGSTIENPGETHSTELKLIGQAERGESGYIIDVSVTPHLDLFPFQADKNSYWEVNIPYLEHREYHFVAKSTRESAPWIVNILPE